MMRSLFAGVSGLRNHQVRMDVIGNNIANVNTVAFKSSRVTFEEAFAQLVQGASRPPGRADADVSGGINPIQVGLGMNIGSIDLLFTQGNLETTGVTTDLAIQGNSFFVVSDGQQNYFTRSGNFQLDATGRLVASTNGYVVQGRVAQNGVLTDQIQDITLPYGQKSAARATASALIGGNLDAEGPLTPTPATRETTITVYDELGAKHELSVQFTKTGANAWDATISATGWDAGAGDPTVTIPITFNTDGTLATVNGAAAGTYDFSFTPDGSAAAQTISLDFGEVGAISGLSQFASPSTVVLREQDGYTMGDLQNIGIDTSGTITGSYSNGVTLTLGQIALADFNNPSGLIRTGDNMYTNSANSGAAVYGFVAEGSQSIITSGALEMSNVDLAQEFTNMITAQRGFQSNARVITASDEMLQELVNLKR